VTLRCRHLAQQFDPASVAGQLELRVDPGTSEGLVMTVCRSCWALAQRFVASELSPPATEREGT